MTRRRTCEELGLCQVEAAIAFDRQCPQPCASCLLNVDPIVVDGSTVAVAVTRKSDGSRVEFSCLPAHMQPCAGSSGYKFPFAPGTIETHRGPRRRRTARALVVVALLAAASAAVGLMAGYFSARGWL